MPTPAELIRDPLDCYPSATVACFDPTTGDLPRRQLDRPQTIRLLELLAAAGAPAVLIAASTGHGHLRTVDELEQWFRTAAEADTKDMTRMALLRPEDGAEANQRLVHCLAELDYPVAFVRPGTDLPDGAGDEQVQQNMQPLVKQLADAGLAVGVYSIPDVSGLSLSAEAAARIVAGPGGQNVVAAKITEADFDASTLRFLDHPRLRHLKIVQGWDPHLARALQTDPRRCGVTSGPMSLAIFQYLHLFQACRQQDWPEVAASQQAVTALFEAMQDDPRRFADLQRAKYIMGLGHPLTGAIEPAQAERVLVALENLPPSQDRRRLARSLDLLQDGPFHDRLLAARH